MVVGTGWQYLILLILSVSGTAQINSGLSNEPIGDIVLYYLSAAPISDATVKPLCAYVSENGNARDLLFDGIIVYNVHLVMGSYPDDSLPNQDTCNNYINALFTVGHQLDSLDAIVGRVKAELNHPDFCWKVILTAPYAEDLPQGNVINYCNTIITLWNQANFSNLELIGFYFGYMEWVNQIVMIMQQTADFLHSKGYKFFWIPCYQGWPGPDWTNYGFDYVTEQPNFAFNPVDTLRFLQVNNDIKKYNIAGAEMELWNQPPESGNRLSALENANYYFDFAERFYWQGAPLITYYYGPVIAEFASTDSLRHIYDRLYNFIRRYRYCTLEPSADAYVQSAFDMLNTGKSEWLALGTDVFLNHLRVYLQFDLSAIDSRDTLDWARLELYLNNWAYGTEITDIQLFFINNDEWVETLITWQNQPYSISCSILDTVVTHLKNTGWRSWDITQFVYNELNGDKKITFLMKLKNEDSSECISYFVSKEHSALLRHPRISMGLR